MSAAIHQPVAFRAIHDNMRDKQKGEEKSYFSKQDAKMLKKLVEKMEKRDCQASEREQEHDAMTDDLSQIFSANGLEKEGDHGLLWQELMEWKRHKYWNLVFKASFTQHDEGYNYNHNGLQWQWKNNVEKNKDRFAGRYFVTQETTFQAFLFNRH